MLSLKSKYAILLLSSVLVVYAVIGGMLGPVGAQNGTYPQLSTFTEVLSRIQTEYVDEPSIPAAIQGAIRGLVEKVDPRGGFLTPDEVAFYRDFDPQQSPGIGAVLSKRSGYPIIVSTMPNGPAARAELGPGDFIEAIDGITTREMSLVQVHSLLAAPEGQPVSLTVIRRRRAEAEVIELNREIVPPPDVESAMLEGDIAYLKIPYLASGTALQARNALTTLLNGRAASVIVDLRFAAGGDEEEGAALANLFIESGTIGYVEGQKFERRTFSADPGQLLTTAPLVVLINQGTAGAAELAAGAIRDSGRGQLVGTQTFGYGAVQQLIPLEDGAALLLAVAKYYTPAGHKIEEVGIEPTIEMVQAGEETFDFSSEELLNAPATEQDADEDSQLRRAIEVLKGEPSSSNRPA